MIGRSCAQEQLDQAIPRSESVTALELRQRVGSAVLRNYGFVDF